MVVQAVKDSEEKHSRLLLPSHVSQTFPKTEHPFLEAENHLRPSGSELGKHSRRSSSSKNKPKIQPRKEGISSFSRSHMVALFLFVYFSVTVITFSEDTKCIITVFYEGSNYSAI